MIKPLTEDQALEIIRANIGQKELAALLSTEDGQALVYGLIAMFLAYDSRDADKASALALRESFVLPASPATKAIASQTTLKITRHRAGATHIIGKGTLVQSSDGHIYATDADLTFGKHELVEKTVTATSIFAGYGGILPAGTINEFVRVQKGISGSGTKIDKMTPYTNQTSIRFKTDTSVPYAFRSSMIGFYLEITDAPAAPSYVGKQARIASVNDGSSISAATQPEAEYAWSDTFPSNQANDLSSISNYSNAYSWIVRDWQDLGYSVTNITDATSGRDGYLDEFAVVYGTPRRLNEDDASLRARLTQDIGALDPISLVRTALTIIAPYGGKRQDIQIYECGFEAANPQYDPYYINFPAALGFISDLHCTDMSSPLTPDFMYKYAPDTYAYNANAKNPGFVGFWQNGVQRFVVLRCDFLDTLSTSLANQLRVILYKACKAVCGPGVAFYLYKPLQWGYS